jgi:hypothetical protein
MNVDRYIALQRAMVALMEKKQRFLQDQLSMSQTQNVNETFFQWAKAETFKLDEAKKVLEEIAEEVKNE